MWNWLRSGTRKLVELAQHNPFGDRPDYPVSARVRAILDEWRLWAPPPATNPAHELLKKLEEDLVQDRSSAWTWDDLEAAKMAVVALYQDTRLRLWIVTAREEFRSLAGESTYAAYVTAAPNPQSAPIDDLRQDGFLLLQELRKLYRVLPEHEERRNALTRRAALVALCILAIGVGIFLLCPKKEFTPPSTLPDIECPAVSLSGMPLLAVIMLCGALGGAISAHQRIQNTAIDGNASTRIFFIANKWTAVYLAPILGLMFAVVLYVIIASGLIAGAIFPDVYVPTLAQLKSGPCPQAQSLSIAEFAEFTGPKNGIDVAKVLVWAFIAGFAERLVPDTLNRLAASAQEGKKT
jgi:hypothetical protein